VVEVTKKLQKLLIFLDNTRVPA